VSLSAIPPLAGGIQESRLVKENPHHPRFRTIPLPKGSSERGTQAMIWLHSKASTSASSKRDSRLIHSIC
jgi:hypothetical protein